MPEHEEKKWKEGIAMADIIKVDTARVSAAATVISKYNKKIRDDFSRVEYSIKALDREWVGKASTEAVRSFQELKDEYCDARYEVINNYVKFLKVQIDAGYEMVEKNNEYLADLFKK
ncbi:WXG100 family type VII secretion target [Bacillus sp. B-jedd]|uniref:WXG100 family type VII secretion target n=1 Tax=Bacillus sp. B-jedd TaxID=1476857 RepID=UPI00051572B4|nr:WXG100 family type VII secretion target [Bacillus sp. B-jedd]CEG28523.1 Proteins of 100 residues with WXG [Bacillus sp. B-jedd]